MKNHPFPTRLRAVLRLATVAGIALVIAACSAGPTVSGIPETSLDASLPRITAHNTAFTTPSLTLTGSGPHEIAFDNQDSQPHNVGILDASGTEVFKGGIIQGPAGIEYDIPALAPGTYSFRCDVHPQMTGTITIS
jgi:plastocyanin